MLVLTGSAFALQNSFRDRVIGPDQARALAARAQASDFRVVVNDQVLARINRLVGTPAGREFIQGALSRMPDDRAAFEQRLAESGMPASLVAVALVESGFRNDVGLPTEPTIAPALRGAGIWMFIPATARNYGLSVQPLRRIDERLDVAKETDAAIAYLVYLHQRFCDWHLALAAYNQGERQVDRAIGKAGSGDPFALAKQGYFNDYLATVMAGVVVLANPSSCDEALSWTPPPCVGLFCARHAGCPPRSSRGRKEGEKGTEQQRRTKLSASRQVASWQTIFVQTMVGSPSCGIAGG